ncbi:MAG: hypothetical protein DMF69_14020, partial [Acidobacteria bacterium]
DMVSKQKSEKKVVFVSHKIEDAPFAAAIKSWLEDNLNDRFDFIDVFVSSHKDSVQLGDNWFDKLRESLKNAKICLCLVSPHSIESRWLYFESGAAFFRTGTGKKGDECPVVPICFGGVQIKDLKPPLDLSQAIELPGEEAESNLLNMVVKRTELKPVKTPEPLKLPEFRYLSTPDWQFSVESLAVYEQGFNGKEIYVISADLGLDILNGPMAPPVKSNLEKGIKYKYIVPQKNELNSIIESIRNA